MYDFKRRDRLMCTQCDAGKFVLSFPRPAFADYGATKLRVGAEDIILDRLSGLTTSINHNTPDGGTIEFSVEGIPVTVDEIQAMWDTIISTLHTS